MERWNELIAGYVLGNLTEEESQELSEILRDNPHLRLEISRLRKTATMSHSQRGELTPLDAGAEGWTDTVHHLPEVPPVEPAFPEKKPLMEAMAKSGPTKVANPTKPRFSFRGFSLATEALFQRTSLVSWLMTLMLIGVGIDNWRVRRLLAIAQDRILQLELSSEYQPVKYQPSRTE